MPMPITRDDPVNNDIRNVAEPGAKFAALRRADVTRAAWMPDANE